MGSSAPPVPLGQREAPQGLAREGVHGHHLADHRLEDVGVVQRGLERVHRDGVGVVPAGENDDGPPAGQAAHRRRDVQLRVEGPLPDEAAVADAVRAEQALVGLRVEWGVDQAAGPHDGSGRRPVGVHTVGVADPLHAGHVLRVPDLLPVGQGDGEERPKVVREEDVALHDRLHLVAGHGVPPPARLPHAEDPLQLPVVGAQGAHRVGELRAIVEVAGGHEGVARYGHRVRVVRSILRDLVAPPLAARGRVDRDGGAIVSDGVDAAAVQRQVPGIGGGRLELPAELAFLVQGIEETCGALDVHIVVGIDHRRAVENLHVAADHLLVPPGLLKGPAGTAQVEGGGEAGKARVVEVATFDWPEGHRRRPPLAGALLQEGRCGALRALGEDAGLRPLLHQHRRGQARGARDQQQATRRHLGRVR
mmetsp:Transcript_24891/g.68012  ORF Transcript_24891/g.68012 Transcript_24891/m.68012 type:complete len:421 (-) Transcript_24891:58-1320(-)